MRCRQPGAADSFRFRTYLGVCGSVQLRARPPWSELGALGRWALFSWIFMRIFTLLLWLVLLSACRDSTGPTPTPAGSLEATLSGSISETFLAAGAEPPPTREPVTFASARPGVRAGTLGVMGFRARRRAQDAIVLDLRDVAGPGLYSAGGVLNYGIVDRDFLSGRVFYIEAQVQVTVLSSERVQGTFEGVAVMLPAPLSIRADSVRITDGRFDVPIVRSRS